MTDVNEVSATVKAAKDYLKNLERLSSEIEDAQNQIIATSKETQTNINITFDQLLENLTNILNSRRDNLLKTVIQTKETSLKPLDECKNDISKRIEKTKRLINDGEQILMNHTIINDDFCHKSSQLGSLPVIPELKEVPYFTFQYQSHNEIELNDICSKFGEISHIAPIQISNINEKPGALLIEWHCVDNNDERIIDIQEYRLQKAYGNIVKDKHLIVNFSDYYKGIETQCLVRDLRANQIYSFRVCCKFDGGQNWSPWSIIQTASTTIPPYCWRENCDFILADDNRIATSIKELPTILLSDGPQFQVGYSIEFTFLEVDKNESFVGLITDNKIQHLDCSNLQDLYQSFVFKNNGAIIVNGVEKSTKLPVAVNGLKVCFTCDYTNGDKVRVHVDCCDKRVTYDWQIDLLKNPLYFFAQFKSSKSKIMVE